MYFQEAATPAMEGIINLHNDIMAIICFIVVFVCWMLFRTLYLFDSSRNKIASKTVHGTTIELIWTIVPSFILVTIAVPSFALLYSMDEVSRKYSANAMMGNWGGVKYSNTQVEHEIIADTVKNN